MILVLLSRSIWATDLPEKVRLEAGALKQYELEYSVGDIAINPASICNFQILGKDRNIVLLIAGKPDKDENTSTAHLRIWDQKDMLRHACIITVYHNERPNHVMELAQALSSVEGLTEISVTSVGPALWAKATAHTLQALETGKSLCMVSEKILCHIEPSSVLLEEAVQRVNQRLRVSGVPGGVRANMVGKQIVLEGITATQTDSERLLSYARDIFPDTLSRIGLYVRPATDKPTVYVRTRILEVTEGALDELGIAWNTPVDLSLGGSVSGGSGKGNMKHHVFSASGSMASDLLQLSRARGDAKLLAEPAIAVQSGAEAKFVVGGEFPVLVTGDEGDRVEWKEYGLILSVQPDADLDSGEIALQMDLEWSVLDWANAIHNRRTRVPAIVKKSVTDRILVNNNDVVVLAGLLSDMSSRDIKGLQGLSSIPILGELFKSRQFRKGRSRLVMLVQPSLEESLSMPTEGFLDHGRPGPHAKDKVPNTL